MNKKLKNAIQNSFVFPESQHKEDFFRQAGLSYTEKAKRTVPVFYRITAAAAAISVGVGILGASKIRTGYNVNDIVKGTPADTITVSDNTITQPAVTTNSIAAHTANVTTSLSYTASASTAFSASKTTYTHSDASSYSKQYTALKNNSTSIVTADVSTSPYQNEVSAPDISSITTSPYDTAKVIDERLFSMKKISAFAASLVNNSHESPIPDDTFNDINGYLAKKHSVSFYGEISNDEAKIEWMKKSERILDFNEDEVYDIFDVYAYYRAFMTYTSECEYIKEKEPQVPENIMKHYFKYGDIDFNGNIDHDYNDLYLAVDYFFINYELKPKYFDPNFYCFSCPDKYNEKDDMSAFDEEFNDWSYSTLCEKLLDDPKKDNHIAKFILMLSERSMRAYDSYSLFCKLINNDALIADTNGDGKYTMEDFYDIVTFNALQSCADPTSYGYKKYDHAKKSLFTADDWEKLLTNHDRASLYFGSSDLYIDYYCIYFFQHNPFEFCYADKLFYSDMREGIGTNDIVTSVRDYIQYYSPDVYDPRYNFTKDEIGEQFTLYYRNVKSGYLPEPDIDMNGIIDLEDYIYADLLLNLSYAESMIDSDIISEQIKKNFYKNCDYNNNRMSGDLADTVCVELYIVKELGIQEDEVVNEIARYYKEHPDMDIYDYAHYVLPEEVAVADALADDGDQVASTGIRSIKQFMSKIAIFKPRSGDANCDGTLDMSDVVIIMQTLANPNKYVLSDEGRYNADICSTGDGITLKDAFLIQQKLLEAI